MSNENAGFSNPLPQSGWVLDSHLAKVIGVSRETLVDWLIKFRIPHRRPGTRIFINMEVFFNGLPDGLADDEPKKKVTKRSR